ncbi:hypothetical protein Sjap_011368 [Stephania japonica]|uniref:Subtilisin-like protease fibronectin type-III domain-containing protein n=1 Tax=Stephania japonica TaxID=461633 RepID=A0AAP0JB98_9MAGN
MTTAMVLDKKWKHITVDHTGRRGNPFDFGAGFLNPTGVLNPGLVYNAQSEDYKAFLCSVGYDEKSLHLVTGDNSTCNKRIYQSAVDLNYPSISVSNLRDSYSVTRTLTNVGRPRSIYKAFWSSPVGINVTVSPKILVFNKYGEKVNFTVNFKVSAPSKGYIFGTLTGRRGKLRVSSPLVVRVVSSDSGLLR